MDISQWPLNRIMQLPDHCFGTRFVVGAAVNQAGVGTGFGISRVTLPEWCVIWELSVWGYFSAASIIGVKFAIGDQVPANTTAFLLFERLFDDLGYTAVVNRDMYLTEDKAIHLTKLRIPVHSMGRRLVIEVASAGTATVIINSAMVVSGVPKEVPDWLVSAQGRSL